jgi:uncharacterized protein involved in exopolysaccharide biosynthesis
MALEGPNQLLDLLHALSKRRWQVAVPAALLATVGIAFGVIVPKKYLLSMRIELTQTQQLESDRRLRDPRESAVIREGPSASEHVKNFNRIKNVIKDSAAQWPEFVALADENDQNLFVSKLRDENLFAVSSEGKNRQGTVFVDISFKDEDPERAARFLEALSGSWLNEVHDQDLKGLLTQRELYEQMLGDSERDLEEAKRRFFDQCTELQLDPTEILSGERKVGEGTGEWRTKQLSELNASLVRTRLDLERARTNRDQARKRFEDEAPTKGVPVTTEGPDVEARILELVERVDELRRDLQRLQPLHSDYKQRVSKIEGYEAEIQRLRDLDLPGRVELRNVPNERKEAYELELREAEDEVVVLEAEVERIGKELGSLESEQVSRNQAKSDLEAARDAYLAAQTLVGERTRALQDKVDAYRVLEGSPVPWKITQPPVPAAASRSPNPFLIGAFSVLAGLALGVGLAVVSEYARGCYRNASDLAGVMAVPVLGTIDTIVTRAERRRRQAQRAMAGLSTAVIVGCIGWVTWLWVSAPERLPVEVQQTIEQLRTALK